MNKRPNPDSERASSPSSKRSPNYPRLIGSGFALRHPVAGSSSQASGSRPGPSERRDQTCFNMVNSETPSDGGSQLFHGVRTIINENSKLKNEIRRLQAMEAENSKLKVEVLELRKQMFLKDTENSSLKKKMISQEQDNEKTSSLLKVYFQGGDVTSMGNMSTSERDPIHGTHWGRSAQQSQPIESQGRARFDQSDGSPDDHNNASDDGEEYQPSRRRRDCKTETAPNAPTEEDFRAVGAFGIRLLDSYFADSFEGWFKHGASQSQNDSVSSAAMPQDSDREFREALKNAYDFFKARYPIVIESLTRYASYAADGAALTKLVKTIQDSARNARSRDSGKMRGNIFDIIANAPDGPPTAKFSIVNPPLSKDSKSGRCYQHPQLAMLLAPREFVIDLCFTSGLKRKSALEDLKNGRARLSDETLFSFLYNLEKFNNSSQLEGLFRGYTLLRAWRCLYVGASATLTEDPSGYPRKGCIEIYNLKECGVTINQIAYTAVHVFFALSSEESWPKGPGVFNLDAWYRNLINVYCKAPKEWRDDLINFWNRTVFGGSTLC